MSSIASLANAIPDQKFISTSVYLSEDILRQLDSAVEMVKQHNVRASRSTIIATLIEKELKSIRFG